MRGAAPRTPPGAVAPEPRLPELNPVETTWRIIRDSWLSNRVFKSYQDILGHCRHAWNALFDQPRKIISIGTREWAQGP